MLFGPPGAGKGTQVTNIAQKLNLIDQCKDSVKAWLKNLKKLMLR